MNKILFSTGGQPTFLDDLQLIHDNGIGMMSALLAALAGQAGGYLLNAQDYTTEADPDGGHLLRTSANALVLGGEIVSIGAASLHLDPVPADGPVKVCVRTVDDDARTFENGQQNPCRRNTYAYLSFDDTGADASLPLADLPSLTELMAYRMCGADAELTALMRGVPVVFYSGYSGTVQYCACLDGSWKVRLDVRSSATEWDSGKTGIIGQIADPLLVDRLKGKGSESDFGAIIATPDGSAYAFGAYVHINADGELELFHRLGTSGGFALGCFPPCSSTDYTTIKTTF